MVLKTVVCFLPSVERAWLIVPSGGHQSPPWSRTNTSKHVVNARRNNGRALNGRCRQQRQYKFTLNVRQWHVDVTTSIDPNKCY